LVGAADGAEWFAQLWAGGNFDCGPQDYKFMVKEAVALLEVARKLPSSKTSSSSAMNFVNRFHNLLCPSHGVSNRGDCRGHAFPTVPLC
jgi:hypothetical protein